MSNTKNLKRFIEVLRIGSFVGILLMTFAAGRLGFAQPLPGPQEECSYTDEPNACSGELVCCLDSSGTSSTGYRCLSSCDPYSEPLPINECNVEKQEYDDCLEDSPLGVPGTVCDFGTATVNFAYSRVTSTSLNDTVGCSGRISALSSANCLALTNTCDSTDEEVCDQLINNFGSTGSVASGNGREFAGRSNFLHSQGALSGSLLGAVYTLENAVYTEPLPANLAYYFNRQMAKVPFVGETFAQSGTDYGNFLINRIFGVWQVFRNLAYAIIAIIMMVIGIFIILRKKINQQIVVTVQYALPRVIIALVLITFSYPIGALLATLGWSLWQSGPDLATSLFSTSFADILSTCSFRLTYGIVLLALFLRGLAILGAGPAGIAILVGVFIVLVVMFGLLWFKALSIFLKLIFSIVSAPLEFCMGALPGNEDKIAGWFTRMAKYVVTLFAMGIIVPLVAIIALRVLTPESVGSTLSGGDMLTALISMFVLVYGFGLGIGMEKRLDEFFTGKRR